MQQFDAVARRGDHPLDLVVLAFEDGQRERVRGAGVGRDGRDRLRLAVQLHAGAQRVQLRVVERVAHGRDVGLRHLALRRRVRVHELAVVGQQQQAGRVLVEPADALHAARDERRGQQAEHARMVLRIARTLVAGRLVEREIRTRMERPCRIVDREHEAVGVERGVRVGRGGARDGDAAGFDQAAALATRAEALGVENAFEIHSARILSSTGARPA